MNYSKLIIIVEGQTEEEFVNQSLRPWLNQKGIYDIRAIKIRTSSSVKGGNANYQKFKNEILRLLNQQKDVLITSFFDFFRLPTSFPGYDEMQRVLNVEHKITILETSMGEDINSERFVPYIQLHEFESLLFTKIHGFKSLPQLHASQIADLNAIIESYPNPELINNNPSTSPSKRILKIYPSYEKVLHGNYILLENTFEAILLKCPRFSNWINILLSILE
ncbi:MAG TPA: DUF4276 family protein [Saprospiraceae bacterium]|nr:DUF4276 family protein [Saprospiraceae bacterium]HPI05324.1 DUF4276 family protein [Saprospiraceae bacterium]